MGQDSLKILIVSRDLNHRGGVVDTVRVILRKLSGQEKLEHFSYGRHPGQNQLAGYLQVMRDLFSLFMLLYRNRYDVIHVNPSLNPRSFWREAAALIMFRICRYRGKVLIFFHGWRPEFVEKIKRSHLARAVFIWLLGSAGKIIVLSGSYRTTLIDIGIPAEKIIVASSMFERGAVPVVSKKYPNTPKILFLSRLVEGKGVHELLEAFILISEQFQNIELIFAGDGPEKNILENKVRERGLRNVLFAGYVTGEAKKDLFAQSDIFVLPTKFSEGCPVSLLEAMASGLVSVVPAAGGIADVVEADFSAVVIADVSPESVAEGLQRALTDSKQYELISENARTVAFSRYEADIVCSRINDIYKSIAAGDVN